MRVSIRTKLVALLVAVGLLPLTAAVVTIAVGGRELRTKSFGQTMESIVAAEAAALRVSLAKDVEKVLVALQGDPEVVADLAKRSSPPSPQARGELEAKWRSLSVSEEPLKGILNGPLARELRMIQQADPRVVEMLLTDRFGNLVGATTRLRGYYQGGEEWWRGAFHDGRGRVFIPPVDYDRGTGVWSIRICIPILEADKVVGVSMTVLDVTRWVGGVQRNVGTIPISVMLVQPDGRIIYWDDVKRRGLPMPVPLLTRTPEWYGAISEGTSPGWRISREKFVQAYAPIRLPERIARRDAVAPSWMLVMYVRASEALGWLHALTLAVLGVGLGVVGAIFFAGLFLVERSVTRRIRRLEQATRSVAQGDLTHRIERSWAGRRLTGSDEIDDLAGDFNRMVARVQQSHEALRLANELKMNFIRIAGHELRTPITYILGINRLLRDCDDPVRLHQALQNMGAKAKRLDEIIQAMFKIMPDQRYAEAVHYAPVVLSEVLEEVYLDCLAFVEMRHQQLVIEPGEQIPVIQADRSKLYDVVENLVMNAIKFTPDGGVIRIRVGRQLGGMVSIRVRDQGPGIPESDLPHIFEPFYGTADVMKHSSGSAGYQKRGIGLGLTIVRHFVELHGGSVHVSTTPSGSTFTVTIPVEPPPGEPAAT